MQWRHVWKRKWQSWIIMQTKVILIQYILHFITQILANIIYLIEPKPGYNCQTLGNLNQFLVLLLLLLSHDLAQLTQVKLVVFILDLFQQSQHLKSDLSQHPVIQLNECVRCWFHPPQVPLLFFSWAWPPFQARRVCHLH